MLLTIVYFWALFELPTHITAPYLLINKPPTVQTFTNNGSNAHPYSTVCKYSFYSKCEWICKAASYCGNFWIWGLFELFHMLIYFTNYTYYQFSAVVLNLGATGPGTSRLHIANWGCEVINLSGKRKMHIFVFCFIYIFFY